MFLDDAHVLFILEDEIVNLPGGDRVLFDASFEDGKEIAKAYGRNDWNKFVTDYLSALGFGDIAVLDKNNPKIGIMYYPWTKLIPNSGYVIIRGLISGMITQCTGKETMLELLNVNVKDYLTITIGVKNKPTQS